MSDNVVISSNFTINKCNYLINNVIFLLTKDKLRDKIYKDI